MADAAEVVSKIGVDMINLHASAGERAMKTVMERLNALQNRPLVLAVSALTSFNESEFEAVYNDTLSRSVRKFSQMSFEAVTNQNFITLCPGVRPFGESAGDQKRVANLVSAKQEDSDFIVVGRPIYENENPREICERILEQI